MPGVGQGVLDRDAFPQLRAPVRVLLARAQLSQQRLVGMDRDAAAVAAGPQRAGRAGVLGKADGRAGRERHADPGRAGQLPGGEVAAELVLGEPAAGVADPPGLAVDGQVRASVADQPEDR